jgi:hypothetical protein
MQVLENTLLKPFGTLISCRDTIDSECPRGMTKDQCVDYCKQNPFCACGYYIEPHNGKSYCAPLNSVLLKNMNLHLNTYPLETDPTKDLWKSSAVFYRPHIYPLQTDTRTIIMQKDICFLSYHYKNSVYYMQSDFSFRKNGKSSAGRILFIDKYPQFYELANTVQNSSTFVIKLFAQPQVLSVLPNKTLGSIPYLTLTGEQEVPDLTLWIPGPRKSPLDYQVLTFDSQFQILTNKRTSHIGVLKDLKDTLVLGVLPFTEKTKFKGYFKVERVDIQPNIYKVAQILPARLIFLRDSIDFPSQTKISTTFLKVALWLLSISFVLVIVFSYLKRRREILLSTPLKRNFAPNK